MKKAQILVADIGSTITKLCAFGGLGSKAPQFLGQGVSLTTVKEGDMTIGLENAHKDLEGRLGIDTSVKRMVQSY